MFPPPESDAGGSEEDCAEDGSLEELAEEEMVGVEGDVSLSSPHAAKIVTSERSNNMQRNKQVDRFILCALLF